MNQLSMIDIDLKNLFKLKKINISTNQLTQLESNLFKDLVNLTELDFSFLFPFDCCRGF